MHHIRATELTRKFECLGADCEDTCCQNWSMQVDAPTLEKYKSDAPELLAAVDMESDGIPVMRRDPETRYCVKLDGGLCTIHKQFGANMLGDACYFYPRVTRSMGAETCMTVSPSCPQVVRLMLALEAPFALENTNVPRLPSTIKNYLPEGLDQATAQAVHDAFLACAMDASTPPEQTLAGISSVARSLGFLEAATLAEAVPAYLRMAAARIPEAQTQAADPFNLLHMLCGLIVASHKPVSERLAQTIMEMETALGATLDWEKVAIGLAPDSAQKLDAVGASWKAANGRYDHALRRVLAMQISLHHFPYAGLGHDAAEKITFIGVRFALTKLALACAHHLNGELAEGERVRIIQSLSRFMDHLGEAGFSLSIFRETGWISEARLLGLFS